MEGGLTLLFCTPQPCRPSKDTWEQPGKGTIYGCHLVGSLPLPDAEAVFRESCNVFGQQLLIQDLDLTLLSEQKRRMVMASRHHAVFGPMWEDGLKRFQRMPTDW